MDLCFLAHGGQLGRLIAEFDWSQTDLGPTSGWPDYMRATLSVMLQSPVPTVTLWGKRGIMIYNDAYIEFAAKRHPSNLGVPVLDAWPEVADFNSNVLREVFAGRTLSYRDVELVLERTGRPENVWLNLDYSPVRDENGDVSGVFILLQETTNKVAAERELDARNEQLQQMFEQAPGFVAVLTGPDHIFDLTNAAYLQLTGHRDLLGKSIRAALPEIEGQGYYELLDQVYATGEPFIGQSMPVALHRTLDAAPERRFVDFIFQPLKDHSGRISGIFVQGVDVTNHVVAEAQLRESEKQFRTLAEAMPNHVWTSTSEGHFDWFNPRVYEYSGANQGDLDGEGWTSIVHPEDLPAASEAWRRSLSSGEDYEAEFRIRRADGAYRWHVARAVHSGGLDDAKMRWIGTNTDIDDQRRARRDLIDSERRLRLSQQAAGIASMEIDLIEDRVYGSDKLWSLFGLPLQESAPAAMIETLVLPEDRALCSTAETRRSGFAPSETAYRVRRADDGEIRWIARHMELLPDPAGFPIKMYGALRDITEQKEAEARQEMLTKELEHRIKNILMTVSVIASQTLKGHDLNEERKAFTERLRTLSHAHSLLSSSHWTSAILEDVVASAIAPFPRDRISVYGPPVRLEPKRALSLALAVNELGTNSLKYGALSASNGSVAITWSKQITLGSGDRLEWLWREIDGPPVTTPKRSGFGRILIERVMAGDFDGEVEIVFAPSGVECRLSAPWPLIDSPE